MKASEVICSPPWTPRGTWVTFKRSWVAFENPRSCISESFIKSPNIIITHCLVSLSKEAEWRLFSEESYQSIGVRCLKGHFILEPVFSSTKWRYNEAEVFFICSSVIDKQRETISLQHFYGEVTLKNFHTSWFVLGSSLYAETIVLNLRSTFFTLHMPYMQHIMIYQRNKTRQVEMQKMNSAASFQVNISVDQLHYWLCSVNQHAAQLHKNFQYIHQVLFPQFLHGNQVTGDDNIILNSFCMLQF